MKKRTSILVLLILLIYSSDVFAVYYCAPPSKPKDPLCSIGEQKSAPSDDDPVFSNPLEQNIPVNLYNDVVRSVVHLKFYEASIVDRAAYSSCSGIVVATNGTKISILTLASCMIPMGNKMRDIMYKPNASDYIKDVPVKVSVMNSNGTIVTEMYPSAYLPKNRDVFKQITVDSSKSPDEKWHPLYTKRYLHLPDMIIMQLDKDKLEKAADVPSFLSNLRVLPPIYTSSEINRYEKVIANSIFHIKSNRRLFLVGYHKELDNSPKISYGTMPTISSKSNNKQYETRVVFPNQTFEMRNYAVSNFKTAYFGTGDYDVSNYYYTLLSEATKGGGIKWLLFSYSKTPESNTIVTDTNIMLIPYFNSLEFSGEQYRLKAGEFDRGSALFICPLSQDEGFNKCQFLGMNISTASNKLGGAEINWIDVPNVSDNMFFYSILNPYLRQLVVSSYLR